MTTALVKQAKLNGDKHSLKESCAIKKNGKIWRESKRKKGVVIYL